MSTAHLCYDHPDGKQWIDGKASACPHHKGDRPMQRVRMGRRERAALDKQAGVVGQDFGSHIGGGNDHGDFERPAKRPEPRRRHF